MDIPNRRAPPPRQRSFNARALDLASEIGDNRWEPSGGIDGGGISGMPASFSEQLLRERDREREMERRREAERRRSEEEEKGMVNRIMLARMNTLEEGFREVLKGIKDLSSARGDSGSSRRDSEGDVAGALRSRLERPKLDTTGSSGMLPPKTPIGRIGGNDAKARKSPKKVSRRTTGEKGKGVERQESAMRNENRAPSPESVVGPAVEEDARDGAVAAERPGTAVYTPRHEREE